jgi:dihydroorotate dehydrogenase
MVYKKIVKPLFFKLSPERIHELVFKGLKVIFSFPFFKAICRKLFSYEHAALPVNLFGINFPNPVGLAAGFDKDAKGFEELSCFGFGFIEIGTVTPKPQEGNPKPRLFRLPEDQALINRMGFNNEGVEAMVRRLKNRPKNLIVGGNIGKNKTTPNEKAREDYLFSFKALFGLVDYFVVNVSSPNTPNLRELQEKGPLLDILQALQKENSGNGRKPILLKIAPDLTEGQLDDIIDIVRESGIDGIIATNTTIDRSALHMEKEKVEAIGAGGLSGLPLKEKATGVIRYLSERSNGEIPIIAVGGIFSGKDAIEKLQAGASLVQIYTSFIYEGPGIIKKINQEIAAHYEKAR